MSKLKLPNVTLSTATTKNFVLTNMAIGHCLEQCDFGDIAVFSPYGVRDCPHQHIYIEPFKDKSDASKFGMYELHKYITTSHVLSIQWDGYIIDAKAWNPRFLEYDYIGAVWPWMPIGRQIGNGGFCLRSKRLLQILSKYTMNSSQPALADDVFTCVYMRDTLVNEYGIKFAPLEAARDFSYERELPKRSFGFHGLFNMWRHVDDSEMLKLLPNFEDYVVAGVEFKQLIENYTNLGKFKMANALKKRLAVSG